MLTQASIRADLTAVIRQSGWGWGPWKVLVWSKVLNPHCWRINGAFTKEEECNAILWKSSSWTHRVSTHLNPDACLRWDLRKWLQLAASGGEAEDNIVLLTPCMPLSVPLSVSHAVFHKHYNLGNETNLCLSVCRLYLSRSVTLRHLSLKSHVISRNAFALFEVVKVSSLPLQADTISVCEAVSDLYQWFTSPSVISRLQPERKNPASMNHTEALFQNWHVIEANNLDWNKSIHE